MHSVTFSSLREHNFRLYFFAQLVSLSGTWIQTVALSWLAYELTKTPEIVGFIIAAQYGPLALGGLIGGRIADSFPKYTVLQWTQLVSVIPPLVVALSLWLGFISAPLLICLALIQGCVRVIDSPVRQSLISYLVSSEQLKNAVSLYSTASNLARIIGPAIAGVLLTTLGAATCFLLNALSFIFVVWTLTQLTHVDKLKRIPSKRNSSGKNVYLQIWKNKPLVRTLSCIGIMSAVTFTSQVVYPLFAIKILNGNEQTYSYMLSFFAAGAVLGGLSTAKKNTALQGQISLYLFGLALSFMLLGFATSHTSVFLILAGAGYALSHITASANTLVRELSNESYLGTSMALWSMAVVGSGGIGNVFVGYLLTYTSVQATNIYIGSTLLFLALWYTLSTKKLFT